MESTNIQISKESLNTEILHTIEEISGENLYACYQCGNCSASCPMANFMEILPQRMIRLLQLGQVEEALKANTSWICAACVSCRVKCPKGVDFSKIAEGLRQVILRNKENYVKIEQLPPQILANYPQIALVANFRKFTL